MLLKKITFLCSLLFLIFSSLHAAEFSEDDQIFLRKNQRRALDFFLKESNLVTGLVRDRAPNQEGIENTAPASIAASGFALSAYVVGVEHGWITKQEGLSRTRKVLRFAARGVESKNGFFYHFVNIENGKRAMKSEVSPIDTALFIAGALFAAEYFQDSEVSKLVKNLYERIDFRWMQNGSDFFAMSWSPEKKFSANRWDHFDESLLLYALAIGSPTHSIDPKSWHALARPVGSYGGYRMIAMPPLFTNQYPQIWLDLRNKQDGFTNYFDHSIAACKVNRAFAMDQAGTYKTYGPEAWGITASDGPKGYKAYGAPPGWAIHDGTIAPSGCGGCMPFIPQESLACLRHFESYGKKLWGRYGFSDALNDDENWISPQVLAIDQGTLMLMIENATSELIWKTMNRVPSIQKAFEKIGFKPGSKELPWNDPPQVHAKYIEGGLEIDGLMKDWPGKIEAITMDKKFAEFGDFSKEHDAKAKIRFAWDQERLYFALEMQDDSLVAAQGGANIWRDDLFELFIDPAGDGFFWEDDQDFQIGFRPIPKTDEVAAWSWFQRGEDPIQMGWAEARNYNDSHGYVLEGSIQWSKLGVFPRPGMEIFLSPAVHDVDLDRSHRKIQWFFRSEDKLKRFQLGRLILEDAHDGKK